MWTFFLMRICDCVHGNPSIYKSLKSMCQIRLNWFNFFGINVFYWNWISFICEKFNWNHWLVMTVFEAVILPVSPSGWDYKFTIFLIVLLENVLCSNIDQNSIRFFQVIDDLIITDNYLLETRRNILMNVS